MPCEEWPKTSEAGDRRPLPRNLYGGVTARSSSGKRAVALSALDAAMVRPTGGDA